MKGDWYGDGIGGREGEREKGGRRNKKEMNEERAGAQLGRNEEISN